MIVHTRSVADAPDNRLLSEAEIEAALGELSGWRCEDGRLRRAYTFADFSAAIAFMVEVAFDAERLGHHPDWSNVYNRVDVTIWSHDLGGVSARCVALAGAMDVASAD